MDNRPDYGLFQFIENKGVFHDCNISEYVCKKYPKPVSQANTPKDISILFIESLFDKGYIYCDKGDLGKITNSNWFDKQDLPGHMTVTGMENLHQIKIAEQMSTTNMISARYFKWTAFFTALLFFTSSFTIYYSFKADKSKIPQAISDNLEKMEKTQQKIDTALSILAKKDITKNK